MKIYQGALSKRKNKKPHQKYLQKKNPISFLKVRKTIVTDKGINKPSGPLVSTASPEKIKNRMTPAPFIFLSVYPKKNEIKARRMKTEKIISVNTVLDKPM